MRNHASITHELHKMFLDGELKSGMMKFRDGSYTRVYWMSWYGSPEGVIAQKEKKVDG